jgi:hypothetical protein
MLADLGFDPQPAGGGHADGDRHASGGMDGSGHAGGGGGADPPDRIRLRHCPFLELAEEYGTVVCPLHLGLMQGALAELRAPVAATRLEPFAEPDACVAHLAPIGSGHGRPRGGSTGSPYP